MDHLRSRLVAAAVACALTLGLPCRAEGQSRWKKVWRASIAVLAGANIADVHSSTGLWETNPVLRNRDGMLDARRAVLIKSSASGGLVLLQLLLLKKTADSELHKPFAITNLAAAGAVAATTIRNYRIPPAKPPPSQTHIQ